MNHAERRAEYREKVRKQWRDRYRQEAEWTRHNLRRENRDVLAEEVKFCVRSQAVRIDQLMGPGVYFLLKEGRVVYVGRSVNVLVRLGQHIGKDYDSIAVMRVPADKMHEDESFYISLLKPEQNLVGLGEEP